MEEGRLKVEEAAGEERSGGRRQVTMVVSGHTVLPRDANQRDVLPTSAGREEGGRR